MIRGLAWALAVLFVAATVLQLVDQLNLVAQPPDLPDSTNLVDRILGQIPYSQAIWPVFFSANLLIGLGFPGRDGARVRPDGRRHRPPTDGSSSAPR